MAPTLDLVYQYRRLVAACDAGSGLGFDEIELISSIESLFAVEAPTMGRNYRDRPVLGTESISMPAVLRGHRICDGVKLSAIGPETMVCSGITHAYEGDELEVIIDDPELERSYRFRGKVIWVEEFANGTVEVEISLTGVPLLMRYGATATRPASHNEGRQIPKPAALIVPEAAASVAA